MSKSVSVSSIPLSHKFVLVVQYNRDGWINARTGSFSLADWLRSMRKEYPPEECGTRNLYYLSRSEWFPLLEAPQIAVPGNSGFPSGDFEHMVETLQSQVETVPDFDQQLSMEENYEQIVKAVPQLVAIAEIFVKKGQNCKFLRPAHFR